LEREGHKRTELDDMKIAAQSCLINQMAVTSFLGRNMSDLTSIMHALHIHTV